MTDESDVSVDTQPENTATADNGGFFVPEAYQDAGWVKNIKSYDDLWKMNASAQALVGKKTIGVPTDDASDAEINEFYGKIRPQSADEYELDEDDSKDFAQLFYDNGLSKRQVSALTKGIQEIYEKQNEQLFSQEGYDAEMTARFGENALKTKQSVVDFIKREASDEDKAALEGLPNNVIGVVYSLINKVQTRYAVKDSDVGISGSGTVKQEADWENYTKEAMKLSNRPHTLADLNDLKIKYNIPHK